MPGSDHKVKHLQFITQFIYISLLSNFYWYDFLKLFSVGKYFDSKGLRHTQSTSNPFKKPIS